jgi:DNA-binding PadR family transcriptional regulator
MGDPFAISLSQTKNSFDVLVYICILDLMSLPSDTEFELLALLGPSEISGRDLAKLYESETGSTISYGTLYTTLRRMKETGWVAVREDQDEDGRVRFFSITNGGKATLRNARSHYGSMAAFGLGVPVDS